MAGNRGYRKNNAFDNADFNNLFNELYAPLCRFSMKFVTQKNVAEDVVQEVFVYLWENWDRLNSLSNLKSYSYTAVKNRSINYLQDHFYKNSNGNFDQKELEETIESQGPDELLMGKELEIILENGLKALPEKCRTIFVMKRFAELSNKEIASKLNISVKTVEAQMTIAIKKLTTFLYRNWISIFPVLSAIFYQFI